VRRTGGHRGGAVPALYGAAENQPLF